MRNHTVTRCPCQELFFGAVRIIAVPLCQLGDGATVLGKKLLTAKNAKNDREGREEIPWRVGRREEGAWNCALTPGAQWQGGWLTGERCRTRRVRSPEHEFAASLRGAKIPAAEEAAHGHGINEVAIGRALVVEANFGNHSGSLTRSQEAQ